jgi:Secretion system C-terminal sorting domain
MKSSALTTTCTDTTVMVNSDSAKRLKIVGRPGTDTDVDSIWITSTRALTPVTFGNIAASQSNNLVKLNWNIQSEINTNSYIVERSTNGENFTQVGTLVANRSAKYTWIDNNPANGINYYRIVALDNNGTKQYSTVVRITVGKIKADLLVYPNPVKGGQINVELYGINKGTYNANIYNMAGALVYTTTIVNEGTSLTKTIALPLAVKSGNYTFEITNGNFKSTKIIAVQ